MSACVFLGGKSGAGKTVLAESVGVPVLSLDAFFRPADDSLPAWLGRIDWDHLDCFDAEAAGHAVQALTNCGQVDVPQYDLVADRILGTTSMSVDDRGFIAEGVFAPAVASIHSRLGSGEARSALVILEAGRVRTIAAKVSRDLAERRLRPWRSIASAARLAARTPRGQAPTTEAIRCNRENGTNVVRRLLAELRGKDAPIG